MVQIGPFGTIFGSDKGGDPLNPILRNQNTAKALFERQCSGFEHKTPFSLFFHMLLRFFWPPNTAASIFERQFYILDKKCRFCCVFTCFCDFFACGSMLEQQKSEKKNAANDAQGDRNSISRRFMRNQKTAQVRQGSPI